LSFIRYLGDQLYAVTGEQMLFLCEIYKRVSKTFSYLQIDAAYPTSRAL